MRSGRRYPYRSGEGIIGSIPYPTSTANDMNDKHPANAGRSDERPADWWKRATGYQVYPRSFLDSDGDGIGDIPGIVSKLDYLAELGIGFIWLSPVYRSPMADNGYDISDYEDIAPEFGTLADLERLIEGARERDIGIVMDLVVNHTSDEHAWFVDARASRESDFRNFYLWRDPAPDGGPPNAMQSFFGGPAWTLDEGTGQYYLHLFDPKQPDLNWEEPAMRARVWAMMNRWLDRGIAGFRMDVIDLIGKDVERGITFDGPTLHDHLREMHRETLAGRRVVAIGETWSATPETALLYSGREREELSMVFQFETVTVGWDPVHGKWRPKPFDLVALKRVWKRWQEALAEDGWNALFWGNHDLPRAVSAYGDEGEHRMRSAKLLATVLHLMRGTPYVYQGEEFGMGNAGFTAIEQYRDVETLNRHELEREAGASSEDFLAAAARNGRDNARTPVQWSDAPHGGFTSGTPWIEVTADYREVNAAAALADPDSVLAHYRTLIALRKTRPVVVEGDFTLFAEAHPQLVAYVRRLGETRLAVLANVSGEPAEFEVPEGLAIEGECLVANVAPRDALAGTVTLAPWEAVALLSTESAG